MGKPASACTREMGCPERENPLHSPAEFCIFAKVGIIAYYPQLDCGDADL